MSDYVLYRKAKCGHPLAALDMDFHPARCNICGKRSSDEGYKYIEVDLVDVLHKILSTDEYGFHTHFEEGWEDKLSDNS